MNSRPVVLVATLARFRRYVVPACRHARRWLRVRNLVFSGVVGVLVSVGLVAGAGWWTRAVSEDHIYVVDEVPAAPVVLVLGSQVHADGSPSPFLAARLELARLLYQRGKVRVVLVSGDNGQDTYNEVDPMRRWLVARGVPARQVVGDYAGFDTYDSCVRAKKVFGVGRVVVVTQTYHLARAVALCRRVGLDAVGVGDGSVRRYRTSWHRAVVRERFAAVKAGFDALVRPDPTYLGRRERSVDEALR